MPTSLQDPAMAKRTRDSLPPTEFDKEHEWTPLWAGPLLGVGGVVAIILLVRLVLWLGLGDGR
jgi:hypothetical protein